MSLRKLPSHFQTLLSASIKITSYKRAVEELVYNSLDADSTSIAIRINIEENVIQVIDNGSGVIKNDFALLGQKHATSKCVDLSALKSAPNKYGFRGQSLASIIEVSQTVKVTARHEDADDTCLKTFCKGKVPEIVDCKQRPSKGTTVEIKAFLYNLNIQKKSINALNEINDIKHFLEQLSLVHCNTSLSLRDDANNEIILKIHKNRDIYQTLGSLYGIKKTDLQELKVEKNQYKVVAFIGKRDAEINQKRWVFLNGKVVHNGKLQSIINDNLSKSLKLNFQKKRKVKSKIGLSGDDNELSKGKIPFYLVFISCPYNDYDVSHTPKQSILEFKNWDQICKLLEKLIKFYVGDVNLKEVKQNVLEQATDKDKGNKIRDQVKKIMEKILGSNSRRPAVSQLQNGIKGKLAKRKIKKKRPKISLSKIIALQTRTSETHQDVNGDKVNDICEDIQYVDNLKDDIVEMPTIAPVKKIVKEIELKNKPKRKTINKTIENQEKLRDVNTKHRKEDHLCQLIENMNTDRRVRLHQKSSKNVGIKEKIIKDKVISSKKPNHTQKLINTNKKIKNKIPQDTLINRFEKETDSVKQRCNMLNKKVEDLLKYKKKWKRKIVVNETIQYSNIIKDNKNMSVRKKIGKIVIHDYVPLPPKYSPCSFDNRVWNGLKKKACKSSYDLVRTILKTQQTIAEDLTNKERIPSPIEINALSPVSYFPCPSEIERRPEASLLKRLTYDSHNNRSNHLNVRETVDNCNNINKHFITKQYKDNFVVSVSKENTSKRYKRNARKIIEFKRKKPHDKIKSIFEYTNDFQQQSVTIDFSSKSKDYVLQNSSFGYEKTSEESFLNDRVNSDHHLTYILKEQNYDELVPYEYKHFDETYTLDTFHTAPSDYNHQRHANSQENLDVHRSDKSYARLSNSDTAQDTNKPITYSERQDNDIVDNVNVVFVSESQECLIQGTSETIVDPLEICAIVHSQNVEIVEPSVRERNDTLFNDEFYINSSLLDRDAFVSAPRNSSKDNIKGIENASNNFCNQLFVDKVTTAARNIIVENSVNLLQIEHNKKIGEDNFNIRNRLRFVPKGMSPIFENCQTRNVCDYSLDKDYFEKTLYDDFANNVQVTSEMLQPGVQNVKDLTTKEIQKANNKLKKANASLIFKGDSLKKATVLGQVDAKFIAVQIKGRCYQSLETSEYLVLFDQHAVHERIRLENNLADYLIDDKWKSITLDGFTLKLSTDEILYLHNYKDKFSQFGLDWTVLNNREVSVNAIPQAMLGKNPRQVEVVMKAVRNIISEEINAIKLQKGCVSLYPKSIMDLIFSEACRYAIKFGDKLSKNECVELINQLSECKTPFQCAHGRPVMAILMELRRDRRSYAIDMSKLLKLSLPRQH